MRADPHVASVRLIDRKTRTVEVLGPQPLGSRHPTDRQLLYESPTTYRWGPQRVGFCFQASDRSARFLVDKGSEGDALLDFLARHPEAPVRLARPYGPTGVLVES
jgi:hypothetical protein